MNKQEIELAIEDLKELQNQYWESRYYECLCNAIGALEIMLLLDKCKSEPQQLNNGWIPVSRELPKENGYYNVTAKSLVPVSTAFFYGR